MHKRTGHICVVDFGGQYAHLLANRVRRLGVFSVIVSNNDDISAYEGAAGIILSGGPSSVYAKGSPKIDTKILDLGLPILGICYGHQLLCTLLGGNVIPGKQGEYGIAQLKVKKSENPLLTDLPAASPMWMSHGDKVEKIPEDFELIASTSDCDTAAVASKTKPFYGIQFHPEVTHSEFGEKLLSNFIFSCNPKKEWDMAHYFEELKVSLEKQCEGKKVFLLVSGGVDSTVAFVLLNKILGKDRVFGLHIDTGTMRLNESEEVMAFLKAEQLDNLKVVDASDTFIERLKGKFEPEEKRKIIGQTFLDVKDEEVAKLGFNPEEWLLAQGTIYPDTIESGGTDNADTIKTHHNRVESIMEMLENGLLVEPLADLYKDEVRALGEEMEIPAPLIWRHPFPGPGLGVRLLCSDGKVEDIEAETLITLEAWTKKENVEVQVLPLKSVGVQGDARTYAHPAVISGNPSWKQCENYSTALTNNIRGINRVVLQVGDGAPYEYKAIAQECSRVPLDFLRKIDAECTRFLVDENLYSEIWQMPVVSLPLEVDGKPVIVLRPVESSEAMTANFYEMDKKLLDKLWSKIRALGVGGLLYDITHKPPGTIEWE
jgi:GMP synthase (glutamine-hydrolysing)